MVWRADPASRLRAVHDRGGAGTRSSVGVTVAEINLKLIWEVISAIHVGKTGDAFVLDGSGRLVAHSDISLMLGGENNASVASLRALQAAAHGNDIVSGEDAEHRAVLAAAAQIVGPDWTTFAEQPIAEAYGPIRAALWRTSYLLVAGAAFAGALAYLLARRMIEPIKLLEKGAGLIGAGRFDHKIDVHTGDELEGLASRFNEMAGELALSQERSERIALGSSASSRRRSPNSLRGLAGRVFSTAAAPRSPSFSAIFAGSPPFRLESNRTL